MGQLISGELKRFFRKKYLLVMIILLIVLNGYIIHYNYDKHLNYKYLQANIPETFSHIKGDHIPEKN